MGSIGMDVVGKSYYAAVGGVFSPYVEAYMRREIENHNFDCRINDLSQDMVLLSLQGPLRYGLGLLTLGSGDLLVPLI